MRPNACNVELLSLRLLCPDPERRPRRAGIKREAIGLHAPFQPNDPRRSLAVVHARLPRDNKKGEKNYEYTSTGQLEVVIELDAGVHRTPGGGHSERIAARRQVPFRRRALA